MQGATKKEKMRNNSIIFLMVNRRNQYISVLHYEIKHMSKSQPEEGLPPYVSMSAF